MNTSADPIGFIGAAIALLAPVLLIWLRVKAKSLTKELEALDKQEGVAPQPEPKGSQFLLQMAEEKAHKAEELSARLDMALKNIAQYQKTEETLVERLAQLSVELKLAQMERDKLYEHIYANLTIKVGATATS